MAPNSPEQGPRPNPSGPRPPDDNATCREVGSILPAFSLDTADPNERAFVKAHLRDCPGAAETLADYAEVVDGLLFSAPPVPAPPELTEKLRIATSSPAVTQEPAVQDRPRAQRRWWHLWGQERPVWPGYALAAVAVVLLVITNLFWGLRVRDLLLIQRSLVARLEQQDTLIALAGTDLLRRVELAPASEATQAAQAFVLYAPDHTQAILHVDHFPMLPPDQVYQLWLIRGETRTSGGLFRVDEQGRGTLFIEAPEAFDRFDALGITPEPDGGSPGPTSPPVVRGRL